MLNAEQFQENRFEEFWQDVWKSNQMPENLSKAIKDFSRHAYKRGFSDAINETPEKVIKNVAVFKDFLENFSDNKFPSSASDSGFEMKFGWFNPEFTKEKLKQMEKAGIIKVNWDKKFFQLTMKAAKLKKDTEK